MTASHATNARTPHWPSRIALTGMFCLSLALRWWARDFQSVDYQNDVSIWAERLARGQLSRVFAEPFSGYTPPYLYLLGIVIKLFPGMPHLYAVKLISNAADVVMAAGAYSVLKQFIFRRRAALGAAGLFLLPTLLVNSAVWGECDSLLGAPAVWILYALVRSRFMTAIVLWGIAFAFKPQVFFFAPLMMLMAWRARRVIPLLLIPPATYLIFMLPAWLEGRPLADLLTVYAQQVQKHAKGRWFTANAPSAHSVFIFFPGAAGPAAFIGIALTIGFSLFFCWKGMAVLRRAQEKNPLYMERRVLWLAALSALFPPFFLPYMHDRYFYFSDILTYLLAVLDPTYWWLAVLQQASSLSIYTIFLGFSDQVFPHLPTAYILVGGALINALLLVVIARKALQRS